MSLPLYPRARSIPGVSGACPPCPSPGFSPTGRVSGGGDAAPPGLLAPPGGTGITHNPLQSACPPHRLWLPCCCPNPSSLPWAARPLAPRPPWPPRLGRILPCCPVLLLRCAGAAIRGAGASTGGAINASRGAGGSCPLPAPAAPGGGSALRGLSGRLRWLPTCQKALPAPGWGLLALSRLRTSRRDAGEEGTHGDTFPQGCGTVKAAVCWHRCPLEPGGAPGRARLPVPCSPCRPQALVPWLGGTREQ